MTREKILAVEQEIKRFERTVRNLDDDMRLHSYKYLTDSPKQTGAIRRASMDLTRALAEMRKP